VGKLLQDTRVHIPPLLSILVVYFCFYFQLFHCLNPFPLSSHTALLFQGPTSLDCMMPHFWNLINPSNCHLGIISNLTPFIVNLKSLNSIPQWMPYASNGCEFTQQGLFRHQREKMGFCNLPYNSNFQLQRSFAIPCISTPWVLSNELH
jgi:hypothetical protein